MKLLELASRVQMASLPEAEYDFAHPEHGAMPLAYPEAQLGLRFVAQTGVQEQQEGLWTVILCSVKPVDVRDALQLLARRYEERGALNVHEIDFPPLEVKDTGPDTELSTDAAPAAETVDPPEDSADGLETTGVPTHTHDLEQVLIHYLGSQWLQALKGAQGPTGTWLRHRSDQDPLVQALDRVRRLVGPPRT